MKTKKIKKIVLLLIIWMPLPCLAQDKFTIHFKDGSDRTFHLDNIVSIYTSKYDSKNIFHSDESYQYVETLQGSFIYDISSIENIAFTKFNENNVSNNIEEVANTVNPIILENDNIEEIKNKIDDIKSLECVEDAWCDNHSLFVRIKNWETMVYHIDHDENYEIVFPDDTLLSSPNHIIASPNHITASPQKTAAIKQASEPLKVMIANMEYRDEKRQSQVTNCDRLVNLFEYCNIHPDYNDPLPTLEFFKNDIYDYDVIYLLAHGTRKGKYHAFITADELAVNDGSTFTMTYTDLLNKVLAIRKGFPGATEDHIFLDNVKEVRNGVTCIVYRLAITEPFFEELVKKEFSNPNSVLFTCACQSLQDNYNLAYTLYKKNLGCYLGYTHANSVGDEAGVEFYISMLKGCSLGVAYRDLPYNYRIEDKGNNETANLVIVPNDDYEGNVRKLFLAQTITAPPDENLINSEYKTNKKVTIEGYATLLQTGLLGFDVSKNENMEESIETKNIRYEKTYLNGNIKFSTSLSGLEAGETYHFRAFSYDGVVYNYGKTYSFKIDEKQSDTRVQMLTGTVNNATYSIYKEITDESDYHENPDGWKCYRSKLTLDITKNGTTNTYVVDDNIYLDKETQHHGGQVPCMMLDYNKNKMYIFCNSKDDQPYYSMDGNFYSSSINSISFSKETVFEGANFGWYPYFRDSGNDEIHLCNFSYAGYFTILAKRSTSNEWTLYYDNPEITPEDAIKEWEQVPHILVIGTP